MTTANSVTALTLSDVERQKGRDGSLLPVIETLTKRKPFLQDALWLPCSDGDFHKINRRNALPSPSRGRVNQGNDPTKSKTQQVTEVTTHIVDDMSVDARIVSKEGPGILMREAVAHLEGLEQQFESDIIYGSLGSDPDGIDGFIQRLNSTTGTPAGNQIKLVDPGAGNSDQASILLVGWAAHGVHCIYPQSMASAIKHKDYGEVANGGKDANSKTFPAFLSHFEWWYGLAIEDHSYIARAANIDMSNLDATTTSLFDAMTSLRHKVKKEDGSAKFAFYMPKQLNEYLDLQARNGVMQSTLQIRNVEGVDIVTAFGWPIRTAESMTITEDVVS